MAVHIRFDLNEQLFIKDPAESDLGRRIIEHSILLFNKLGYEKFTFKKLAIEINSTEASVYRYFENKHHLLLYLVSWYYEWINYLIYANLINVTEPKKRMQVIIQNIVEASIQNPLIDYVNESLLHKIVVAEGTKAYHSIDVDEENKYGYFRSYKTLVKFIADEIGKYKPDFSYPKSLASNMIEMANNQGYFADHLPALTDVKKGEKCNRQLVKMINYFVFKILE